MSYIDFNEPLASIPSSDLMAILRADEEGPLPYCCANISAIRDRFFDVLRMPLPGNLADLLQLLEVEDHDWDPVLITFRAYLRTWLEDNIPNWRRYTERSEEEDLRIEVEFSIFDTIPHGVERVPDAPRDSWHDAHTEVLNCISHMPYVADALVNEDLLIKWRARVMQLLRQSYAKGTPYDVLLRSYDLLVTTSKYAWS